MAKKEEHTAELIENPAALAEKLEGAEHFIEKNPKLIYGITGAILLLVAGYFGFNYYTDMRDAEAQQEMFQAVFYFEADSLTQALNGDGNNLGFLDIIDEYKFTDAANLSNYYAGVSFLKQGKFDAAILYLNDYSSNDLLVQARAYSLIGDANMEQSKFDEAATYYMKAANYKSNKFYSPAYLMKAALAYEKLNKNDKAIEAYSKVITEFWDSGEYQSALKLKARLETGS